MDIEGLAWLEGRWESRDADRVFQEQWSAPGGDGLIAWSRLILFGRTRLRELSVVEADGDGVFLTVAHFGPRLRPQDPEPLTFRLVHLSADEAVFAMDSDPRRRVIYRRDGPDGLTARVETLGEGVPRVLQFCMRRRREE